LIENKHDSAAFEVAVQNALTCGNLDPRTMRHVAEGMARSAADRALRAGDQDTLVTLDTVRGFVQRLSSLPGQRTLIFLSPGFLTVTALGMREKSQILDLAVHSDVTINAPDARGLCTTELGASDRGPASPGAMATGLVQHELQSRRESMSLNEDVMAELADGSGGSFFHNSNALQGGLERLAAGPECLYMLQVSLEDVKPDGTYHRLKVKVDRGGLQVQARHGYFAPQPDKAAK
jgi:VWFA-related protein